MPTHVVFHDTTTTYATLDTIGVGTFVAAIDLPLSDPHHRHRRHGLGRELHRCHGAGERHHYATEIGSANVVLKLPVLNTTVKGVVKSAKTKKAIKGVKVTVGNKTATTNAKGKYSILIGLWPATKYKATFAWKGHKKATTTFTSAPNSSVVVNKSLK